MYHILCIRSAYSVFGYAEALLKDRDGNVRVFETLNAAKQEAALLNTRNANLRYQAIDATEGWK